MVTGVQTCALPIWKSHPHLWEYGVWLGGLALTFAVTTVLARLALRLLAEAERTAGHAATPPPSRPLEAEPVESGMR